MTVHAGAIARFEGGEWLAALVFGASGSGKSDLMLRALGAGWRLVSDDYSLVWASGGSLWAKAPPTISGRIEARGLGIECEPPLKVARVVLAAFCVDAVDRLPQERTVTIEQVVTPCIQLRALEASALWKLDRALSTRGAPTALTNESLGTSVA